MNPIIYVRRYENKDNVQVNEVIKSYVMSKVKNAIIFCLFREITLQLIILFTAILFIFFELPLIFCMLSFPIVVFLIIICVYLTHYNKYMELTNLHVPICFVAVIHEPFTMRFEKQEVEYCEIKEKDLNPNDIMKMRAGRVVGTLAIRAHHSLDYSAWIYRFAVDSNYSFNQVGKALLNAVLKETKENSNNQTVECAVAECHNDLRELYTKLGFSIKMVYHKNIIGSSLRMMKVQMGLELKKFDAKS